MAPAYCGNKMGILGVLMKEVLPWLIRLAAFAALVSPVQKIIFLTANIFSVLVPIAQQTGQAAVLGRLSLCLRKV